MRSNDISTIRDSLKEDEFPKCAKDAHLVLLGSLQGILPVGIFMNSAGSRIS